MKKHSICPIIVLAFLLAGCSTSQSPPSPANSAVTASPQASSSTPPKQSPGTSKQTPAPLPKQEPAIYAYTYQQPDGNRVISGKGDFPDVEPLDIPLSGTPDWVVAGPIEGGTLWLATLESGQVQAFSVIDETVSEIELNRSTWTAGMPPLLRIQDNSASLVEFSSSDQSTLSHPVPLLTTGNFAFINTAGELVITDASSNQITNLPLNALPDARILVDDRDRLLLLTDPTTAYGHGVLGDEIEAASITLVETTPSVGIIQTIRLPEGQVVEGIMPIWADMDADRHREIIVTISDHSRGARILVFKENGNQVASGPAIGQPFRWRHQIAVGNFGSNTELVDVLTPHIGGIIEFYALNMDRLEVRAQVDGYTSHVIGRRNLDMAVAGDFDGDQRLDLLLPNQALTELAAVHRTAEGAQIAWTLPVGGQMTTNIAAVDLAGQGIALAIGRTDQVLRLWIP